MNAIEIRDLEKHYPGFTLDRVNLTLPSGCILGLVGENGAGKSTTLRLILNMMKNDGGSIRVLGAEQDENFSKVKEQIGVVLDDMGFPSCMTARQIGKMMKQLYRNWDEAMYQKTLKWLAVPMDKSFEKYSRGMKMKQSIAVALSHHPKLLILDEATSGLDPVVRDSFVDAVMDFTRDEECSVLISSHIVSDLERMCDYIAFMHEGKLLLCEEKDVLLERYGVIHVTNEQMEELDPEAILGKRISPYGVEAVADRTKIPEGFSVNPVSLEELFVFMVKGEK